jgi:hypothetical protein
VFAHPVTATDIGPRRGPKPRLPPLRSIGARARDIRRIFATETLALALIGWLFAIPLGYLLDRFLVWLVKKVSNVAIPFAFPLWYLALALAGTILLALLVTLLSISRAVRVRPATRSATRRDALAVRTDRLDDQRLPRLGRVYTVLIRVSPNRRPVGDPVVAVKGAPLDQGGAR